MVKRSPCTQLAAVRTAGGGGLHRILGSTNLKPVVEPRAGYPAVLDLSFFFVVSQDNGLWLVLTLVMKWDWPVMDLTQCQAHTETSSDGSPLCARRSPEILSHSCPFRPRKVQKAVLVSWPWRGGLLTLSRLLFSCSWRGTSGFNPRVDSLTHPQPCRHLGRQAWNCRIIKSLSLPKPHSGTLCTSSGPFSKENSPWYGS